MKNILFVCSHLYSGSSVLCDALNQNPRIQGYKIASYNPYSNPVNLLTLTGQNHKLNNRSAIYMEELLYNHHLTTKVAYKECKFIYVIREPRSVLNFLINKNKMAPSFAVRHYRFRLRRIWEMAKKTPGAILLTWDDLAAGRGISMIDEYLNLKKPLAFNPLALNDLSKQFTSDLIDVNRRVECEDSFQKYLYSLKNLNLKFYQ